MVRSSKFVFPFSILNSVLGFDEGSPDGNDPLQIARAMANRGIVLVRLPATRAPSRN